MTNILRIPQIILLKKKWLFVGLLVGLVVTFIFQYFGPFVEILILRQAGEIKVENYVEVILNDKFYILYYLVANFITIYISSFLAGKHADYVDATVCGLLYFSVLNLFDFELYQQNRMLYSSGVLVGILAILLALKSVKSRRGIQ